MPFDLSDVYASVEAANKFATKELNTIVRLNETTYSGVDIKLVVLNGAASVLTSQIKRLEGFIADCDARLSQLGFTGDIYTDDSSEQLARNEEEVKRISTLRINYAETIAKMTKTINSSAYLPIATAQTLSVQIHREKIPVRALGYVNPKGFCRGPVTIAGSIIFTVFNEHPLASLFAVPPTQWSHEAAGMARPWVSRADQLPPLTLIATFNNEYGSASQLNLYGVEFINDGMVMSIEDIYLENPLTFVARDFDPLLSLGRLKEKQNGGVELMSDTASSLLRTKEYQDYKNRFDVRAGRFI